MALVSPFRQRVDVLRQVGWCRSRASMTSWKEVGIARKENDLLVAEVKGEMTNPGDNGISADILFGQLLRRMTQFPDASRYAAVVPEPLLKVVDRVSPQVREQLGIEVWVVPGEGDPWLCAGGPAQKLVEMRL